MNTDTSGSYNSSYGSYSLYYNTRGDYNVALGTQALYNNTTGNNNTAVGPNALLNNVAGSFNIAVGYSAGVSFGPTFTNTISIGNNGYLNGFGNQAFLGNLSTIWNGGNMPWSTFSDERVKNNITEDVKGLEFITRLRPVTYYRNIRTMAALTGNKETEDFPGKYDIEKIKFTGFLAQEVARAAKDAGFSFSGVTTPRNDKELYTLSYESFVVPLVKGMQEQQTLIINQQKQIDELRKEIEKIKINNR
jgi:hypothetical protein